MINRSTSIVPKFKLQLSFTIWLVQSGVHGHREHGNRSHYNVENDQHEEDFPVHVRSGGNFISLERIGNVAFMFRAIEAARAESILLPLQALSATSLAFYGVFFEKFCVLGLRSQVCD
jgi:hypothetical protein